MDYAEMHCANGIVRLIYLTYFYVSKITFCLAARLPDVLYSIGRRTSD